GLRLSAAPQGLRAPPPLGYGSAYGFSSFSIGNAGNLEGAPPSGPPSGPSGSGSSNWLLGRLPLGSGAPGGVLLGRPPNGGPPGGWGPAIGMFLPYGGPRNHYYYYYNASAPAQNDNDWSDPGGLCKALACEGWLEIQKPKPFSRHNPQKLDYHTAILCFNPGHPLFTNWQVFINEFSSMFGVFDTVAEAARKLVSLRMSTDERFTIFIVQFEKEAYETGWNYNALRFQLSETLPK
ncbi:hypothetical protein C0995_009124, partial [Termitomyces sp. Mi166